MPTENVWIYDNRTNINVLTKKERPLTPEIFEDFEKQYGDNPNGSAKRIETERFKKFQLSDIEKRGYKLDVSWIKDDNSNHDFIDTPEELAQMAIDELKDIIKDLESVLKLVGYEK